MRILTDIRKYNPNVLFLLENVEMGNKWERILSEAIGIYGVHINSALVSAQNRKRIYWTNIRTRENGLFGELYSDIPQPEDRGILLKDILEDNVDEKYYLSDKVSAYLNRDEMNKRFMQSSNDDKSICVIANSNKDNMVIQINPSLESGGKQPYQQNRIYSTDGIMPALSAQLGGRNNILVTEATLKGYVEINPGECFDAENLNSKTRRCRKMTDKSNCLMAKETDFMHYSKNARIRRLTTVECERLQTVEDNYTAVVSDTQRYKMLGNGWTVDVIAHIFSFINNGET